VPFVYPAERGTVWYPTKWSGQKVLWIVRPSYAGPVLIRGHRIDGPQGLGFGEGHVPSDELRLTASQASDSGWSGRMWPSYTRLRAPGCYGWQIDGTNFSTVIVFRAVLTPGAGR
jgi:hypothetical protein